MNLFFSSHLDYHCQCDIYAPLVSFPSRIISLVALVSVQDLSLIYLKDARLCHPCRFGQLELTFAVIFLDASGGLSRQGCAPRALILAVYYPTHALPVGILQEYFTVALVSAAVLISRHCWVTREVCPKRLILLVQKLLLTCETAILRCIFMTCFALSIVTIFTNGHHGG